jgi:hypothetical protein
MEILFFCKLLVNADTLPYYLCKTLHVDSNCGAVISELDDLGLRPSRTKSANRDTAKEMKNVLCMLRDLTISKIN